MITSAVGTTRLLIKEINVKYRPNIIRITEHNLNCTNLPVAMYGNCVPFDNFDLCYTFHLAKSFDCFGSCSIGAGNIRTSGKLMKTSVKTQ